MIKDLCINTLTYHNITDNSVISYTSISRDLFRKHLEILRDNNLRFFSSTEIKEGVFLKDKSKVLITFDDGYEDLFYNALPLVKEFSFNPIVFIPVAFLGRENLWDFSPFGRIKHLSSSMLINMSKNGFVIGSHSLTHVDLRKCEKKALEREICDSKKLLEDIIGEEVYLFAYPFGLFNEKVIEAVAECGYKYAFATSHGKKDSRFAIERASVYFIDRSPLPLLKPGTCSIYKLRNRVISALSSLTPLYKRLFIREIKS